jgi:hypothetical protein
MSWCWRVTIAKGEENRLATIANLGCEKRVHVKATTYKGLGDKKKGSNSEYEWRL